MKNTNLLKGVVAFALTAACAAGVVGCADNSKANDNPADKGLTGGVAATVNGTEIEEDRITRYVNNLRASNSLEEDDAWAEYLSNQDKTPESYREELLDTLIDQQLILQFADERGDAATDEEIQGQVDKMRANYSSDEAWQTALEGAGFADEQAYRDALKYSIAAKKVEDDFSAEAASTVEDATVIEEANSKLSEVDTTRKSSHILFAEEDKEKAQEVLDQINAGTLDFAEAATEYSTDTGSASKGGDVGWDYATSFVEEYQTALDGLEVNQVSELVQSQYGYHIIKCTDIFTVPEGGITSVDQLPADIVDSIKKSSSSTAGSDAQEAWLKEKRDSSEVTINPMPENVPYNVDMSKYESEEKQEEIDTEAGVETDANVAETEAAVDGASAEGTPAEEGAESSDASDAASSEQNTAESSSAAAEGSGN